MEFKKWHVTGGLYSPRVGVWKTPPRQVLRTEAIVESGPQYSGARVATQTAFW